MMAGLLYIPEIKVADNYHLPPFLKQDQLALGPLKIR